MENYNKVEKDEDGNKLYFLNGELHRTDGPAIEYANGTKTWWTNDKLHRTDGPAIECANGNKLYFLNGAEFTEEEFLEQTQVVIRPKVQEDFSRWNSKCHCGAPAYDSGFSVECSKGCK